VKFLKIINWQAQFTAHQYHTWVALQGLLDEKITHVVAKTNDDIRQKQGWTTLDLSNEDVIKFKAQGWWRQGTDIINSNPNAIHVFGGFWANKCFFPLILYAAFKNCKLVIMNESYAVQAVSYLNNGNQWINQLKAKLRPILYRIASFMIHSLTARKNVCLLALSTNAVNQFVKAGFNQQQVFPFGYFVPATENNKPTLDASNIKLVFIGNLLEVKGIDIAIRAVEQLNNAGVNVKLDIYGAGNPNDFIPKNASTVSYKGVIPFGESQSVITQYHALVLPSRHDGWGVVVNEALLQGVPVIVSDHVGAKCLVENNKAGLIFKHEDSDDLAAQIKQFCLNSELRNELTSNAQWVGNKITPYNAAKYMKTVFSYYFDQAVNKPKIIWEK